MALIIADAASGELRRKHYRAGVRSMLLTCSDNNHCPRSEDLQGANWVKNGTGSATGGQADPKGGTTAYLLDDTDAVLETNFQSPQFGAYTGAWTTRGFSFFCKANTAALSEVAVRDETAGVYRGRFKITWTAGVPVVTLDSGAGRVVAVIPCTNAPGWYRVLVEVDTITVANNHKFWVRPAGTVGTAQGSAYFWGFHAHNIASPLTWYVPNSGASGSVTVTGDALRLPWAAQPGALTIYFKFNDLGLGRLATVQAVSARVWQLSDVSNADPRLLLIVPSGGTTPIVQHVNAATGAAVQSQVGGWPAIVYGDTVEIIVWLYQDGSVQIHGTVNGTPVSIGVRSAAKALPAAWAADGLLTSQWFHPFSLFAGAGGGELLASALLPGIHTFDEARSQANR